MLRAIILVGLGGGAGSILRYLTSVYISKYTQSLFPWKTFVVNLLGCLVIGLLTGLIEKQQLTNPELKLLFVTGFCGGYTTFSAFSYENFQLLQSGNFWIAFLYTLLSVFLGLFSVWIGFLLIRLL